MDSKEKIIELQITFSRKNISVLFSMLVFMLISFITYDGASEKVFAPCGAICVIVILDVMLASLNFFHSYNFLRILKIFELFVCGLFISSSMNFSGTIADMFVVLTYVLICVELGYLMDWADKSRIYIMTVVFHLPFVAKMIYGFVTYAPNLYIGFSYLLTAIVSYMIVTGIYLRIREIQQYNIQLVYAKDRLLDRANDNYNKIVEDHNDLIVSREHMGVRKYELEEAYKKINVINENIKFQNKLMKLASSSLDINEVISKCSEAIIASQDDIFYASIVFKEKELRKNFSSQLEKTMEPLELQEFLNFFLSDAFVDEQAMSGAFYINNDISFDEFPFLEGIEARSIIVKSINVQSADYMCVFVIMSHLVNAFKDKETLYDNILRQIEVAANNIFMYSKIIELSNRDGLTGLYNRRYLNLYYNEHFVYDKISGAAVAALLDIDHFKSINDTYGHLFGDQALKSVANVIKQLASNHNGLAFRYGGEEFLVLFEDISLDDAVIIMERIRNHIKETPISHEGDTIYAKVSIGVACYPETTKKLSHLIDRADKAMYYSKQNGRDRLTVDNGED